MSKAWELFLPEVLPEVPGCPDVQAINAIRNAAIEFCEKSQVWRYDIPSLVSLVADQSTYTLVPPSGSDIATVTYLGFIGSGQTKASPVDGPMSVDELDIVRPTWREDESSDSNTVDYFTIDGNTIRLIPIPVVNQTDALRIAAALKPTRDSTEGPDTLYREFLEFIAAGAKARLMMVQDKPWTNADAAKKHEAEFRRGIRRATAKVKKGGGNVSVTAHQRSFV